MNLKAIFERTKYLKYNSFLTMHFFFSFQKYAVNLNGHG